MIKVYIPKDKEFNYLEAKNLFNFYKKEINDDSDFDDIIKNTFFYSFYNDSDFIGCLYFYKKDEELYVNAFSKRHKPTKECFDMALGWFNCDIYAKTPHKAAVYRLLSSGFKKIDTDLYKYERG